MMEEELSREEVVEPEGELVGNWDGLEVMGV